MGHSCILEAEGVTTGNTNFPQVSLDTTTDWQRMDIRSITKDTAHFRNHILAKNKQLGKWNQLSEENQADSLILYFHDPSMYAAEKVVEGYKRATEVLFQTHPEVSSLYVRHIYCVVRGQDDWIVFDF